MTGTKKLVWQVRTETIMSLTRTALKTCRIASKLIVRKIQNEERGGVPPLVLCVHLGLVHSISTRLVS